jgi:signal peptidase II
MPRRFKLFLILAPLTMLADQLTKVWARHSLPSQGGIGQPVTVIENFFDWRLSHNPGSAFGLFGSTSGARVFLSIIGVVAVAAIIWMLYKARDDQRRLTVALSLVAGGAVGNLIDRIYSGIVTDFIVWKYYDHEWPTFNVADIALVVGVGLLFLDIGRDRGEEVEAAAAAGGGSGGKGGKGGKGGGGSKKRKKAGRARKKRSS